MSCGLVADQMEGEGVDMERLVHILCQEGYNKHGANLRSAFHLPMLRKPEHYSGAGVQLGILI